jgi:putative protease
LDGKRRTASGAEPVYRQVNNRKQAEILPIYVSCENRETAKALLKQPGIRGMYLAADAMEECLKGGLAAGLEMYVTTPQITRGEIPAEFLSKARQWLAEGMSGFLVKNLETYAALKEEGLAEKCVIDHSLYTWNNEAVRFWDGEHILRNTIPLELNEKELRHRDNRNSEMLIYGYLPLMVSAQCVRKNRYGCNRQEEILTLKDRYEKEFPVACCCHPWKLKTTDETDPCYNIIYNSIPFGLLTEKNQVEALGVSSLRLAFTLESAQEAVQILQDFCKVYQEGGNPPKREYTKGHFKRGAE